MNAKNELEQCTLAEFCWQHLSISIWTCLTQFFLWPRAIHFQSLQFEKEKKNTVRPR